MCYNFHTQRHSFILLELVFRKGGTSPMKRRMLRQSSKYACSPHSKKSKPRLSMNLLSLFVYTLSILRITNTTPIATSSKTITAFTNRNKVELSSILTLLSGASLGTFVPFFIVKTTSELCQSAFEMNEFGNFFFLCYN